MVGLTKPLKRFIGCLIVYEDIINVLSKRNSNQLNASENILPKKQTPFFFWKWFKISKIV